MLRQLTSFYYFYETEIANVKTKDTDTETDTYTNTKSISEIDWLRLVIIYNIVVVYYISILGNTYIKVSLSLYL